MLAGFLLSFYSFYYFSVLISCDRLNGQLASFGVQVIHSHNIKNCIIGKKILVSGTEIQSLRVPILSIIPNRLTDCCH